MMRTHRSATGRLSETTHICDIKLVGQASSLVVQGLCQSGTIDLLGTARCAPTNTSD